MAFDILAEVVGKGSGDVSFRIDLPAEELIDELFRDVPIPVTVVAEGLGTRRYPHASDGLRAQFRVIIDPVDGSRELMYDKRSAFVLTGVAPERGDATNLNDVVFGLVTEIPPTIQEVGVQAWATRGGGAFEPWLAVTSYEPVRFPRQLRATAAASIRGGFACFVNYFPGTHAPIGAVADGVLRSVLGDPEPGEAAAFDDSYISTGGQLYLMASGRYRLIADLRPMFDHGRPGVRSLCAHPYDLAGAALLAEEAGAIVVGIDGLPLSFPLDTTTNCAFVAYANESIRAEVEPHLQGAVDSVLGPPSLRAALPRR